MTNPVYTTENECQDCYKCVRHCPVKAIRIVNGKASVIPEACVACGECVKVCPAHAKKIRNDLARLKEMLSSGEPLYASVAPSFTGYFKGVTIGQLAAALKHIGFAEVSETAHGAESVSAHVARLLDATTSPLVISSACPAAVDMVRKYMPGYAKFISPLPSPVRAHCRLIKEKFGSKAKVVFFGPCAAKKNEADANPGELALAVVFPALEQLFEEKGVKFGEDAELALGPAEEGRFYSVEGGMNDTLRDGRTDVRYVSVSGLEDFRRMLEDFDPKEFELHPENFKRKLFVEVLACPGGCVNGPAMPRGASGLATLFATDANAPIQPSTQRCFAHCGVSKYEPVAMDAEEPTEDAIAAALARVGKYTKAAEKVDAGFFLPDEIVPTAVEGGGKVIAEERKVLFNKINFLGPGQSVTYKVHAVAQERGNHKVQAVLESKSDNVQLVSEEMNFFYDKKPALAQRSAGSEQEKSLASAEKGNAAEMPVRLASRAAEETQPQPEPAPEIPSDPLDGEPLMPIL